MILEVGRGRVGPNPGSLASEPEIHPMGYELILMQRSFWAIPSQARVQGELEGQVR